MNALATKLLITVALVAGSPCVVFCDVDLESPITSSVEEPIAMNSAPPAVQNRIKEHAGNATVKLFKQFEDGRFVYEAQFTKKGVLRELKIAQDGTILMRREPRFPTVTVPKDPGRSYAGNEIPLRRAPALVQETIREQAGTNTLQLLEWRLKENDRIYVARFTKEGVAVQVKIAENGKIIGPSAEAQVRDAQRTSDLE